MPVLSVQPCKWYKERGQIGHFFVFLETITDCNAGFPLWRRLQNSVVFFSLKIGLAQAKKGFHTREAREPHTPALPVSLSVFSLAPELLFDCSRVLEYAKIRTLFQCSDGAV